MGCKDFWPLWLLLLSLSLEEVCKVCSGAVSLRHQAGIFAVPVMATTTEAAVLHQSCRSHTDGVCSQDQ